MEENFDVLRQVGLVDTPIDDYVTVYGMTVLAMMSPMLITIYIYSVYLLVVFIKKKRMQGQEVEHDPDFEEDTQTVF